MAAGYSGTPLATKLGVKPGDRVVLRGAPATWAIEGVPDRVAVSSRFAARPADVVVAFFCDLARLRRDIVPLSARITTAGALWVAWPRRAGGHRSDLTDNLVREVALPLGLVDVKVAALDDDWSALKLVWRKDRRTRTG